MRVKSSDFKLGLFVVIGLGLLVIGMFIFGASKWFESTIMEETYATGDVGGLKVGSTVTLRGVHVGEVKKIKFSWNVYHQVDPRYVVIVFEIRPDASPVQDPKEYAQFFAAQVKKGLRARIKSQGLAGATILSLEYVTPPDAYPPLQVPWKPKHIYIPSAPGQFNEILASVDKTMERIKQVDLEKLVNLIQQDLVSIQSTLGKLQNMMANVDESSLNATLQNLQRATEELQQAAGKINQYPSGAILGGPPPHAKSVERPHK